MPRVGAGELSVEGRGAGLQGTADGGVRVGVRTKERAVVRSPHPPPTSQPRVGTLVPPGPRLERLQSEAEPEILGQRL